MNDKEKRLCKKCGKRLPSSNNYCMYCGCNNNIVEEELQKENTSTKKESKKLEEVSLKNKIIYAFIMIDIIFISMILINKGNGLFYEKFKYDLDKYDKVINLDNKTFLVLKNKKIEVLGNPSLSSKIKKDINNEAVLDIVEKTPGRGEILIQTEKNIYSTSSSFSYTRKENIKNSSGNIYKDISNQIYNKININDEYYTIIDNNYYIKDDSLYKNENINDNYYSFNQYQSKLIIPKETLNIKNAKIIWSSSSDKSIIIKGDNSIKIISSDKVLKTINSITYNNKKYSISDFKYILFSAEEFMFIKENGYTIKYKSEYSNIIRRIELDEKASSNYLSLYKNILKDTNIIINNEDSNNIIKKYLNIKSTILLLIIIILIGSLYYFREKGTITLIIITTIVVYLLYLLYLLYLTSKISSPKYLETIKDSFKMIPFEFIISIIIVQIKEISEYLLKKLNIETLYHFPLSFISCACYLLVIVLFTNDENILIITPGLIWALLTLNNEEYEDISIKNINIIKLLASLLISIITTIVLCSIFTIWNYYLFILTISFCISYYINLNNNLSITDITKRFIISNILLLISAIVGIIDLVLSLFGKNSSQEFINKYVKEILKYTFITDLIKLILIVLICFLLGIILSLLKEILKKYLDKIDNRIEKILITMIFIIIIISLIVILIPYLDNVYKMIINYLLK